jgi:hypothetical protein
MAFSSSEEAKPAGQHLNLSHSHRNKFHKSFTEPHGTKILFQTTRIKLSATLHD